MRKSILATIFASGLTFAADHVTATGKVTDAAGKPLERATVFIYEGHVKKGYAVYCPTCWADCGKHASNDARRLCIAISKRAHPSRSIVFWATFWNVGRNTA
jgi:hypothetical protein